jgi:hypothetical protein
MNLNSNSISKAWIEKSGQWWNQKPLKFKFLGSVFYLAIRIEFSDYTEKLGGAVTVFLEGEILDGDPVLFCFKFLLFLPTKNGN